MNIRTKNMIGNVIYDYFDEIISQNNQKGLFPLQAPTSAGKSFAMNQFLIDAVKNEVPMNFFIVTTLKENIKSSEKQIREGLKSEIEQEKVLVLNLKNKTEVLKDFFSVSYDIPRFIKENDDYKYLKKYANYLIQQDKKGIAYDETIQNAMLSYSRKVINLAKAKINIELRTQKETNKKNLSYEEKINFIQNSKNWKWLFKFCPELQISLSKYKTKIIFLTADKAIFPFKNPFYTYQHFCTSKYMKNSFIFFDESDSIKKVWFKHICGNEHKEINLLSMDILNSKDNIHDNILNKAGQKGQNAYKRIISETNTLYKKYPFLRMPFKFAHSEEDPQPFLFHTFNTSEIIGDDKRKKYIILTKDGINLIKKSKVDKDKKEITLHDIIIELHNYLYHMVSSIFQIANGYFKYVTTKEKKHISYENALRTVMSNLKFHSETIDFIVDTYFEDYIATEQYQDKIFFQHDFYLDGFSITRLEDSEEHGADTYLYFEQIRNTPEKILSNMALNSKIILLSATAENKSILENFDLPWLQLYLGNTFYHEMSKEKKKELRIWCKQQVHTPVEFAPQVDTFPSLYLLKNLKEKPILLEKTIKKEIQDIFLGNKDNKKYIEDMDNLLKDKTDLYKKQQWLVLFLLYADHVRNNTESTLLYLNSYVKERETLIRGKNLIDDFYESQTTNEILRLGKSNSNEIEGKKDLEKSKKIIDEAFLKGNHVFVLTNYQASSVGQNLQHLTKMNKNNLIRISNREPNYSKLTDEQGNPYLKKDYDCIVLFKRTYVIQNKSDKNVYDKRIPLIYERTALYQNYELDQSQLFSIIKSIHSNIKLKDPTYLCYSFKQAMVKIITQAVGRISRTCYRNRETKIFLEEDLKEILAEADTDEVYSEDMEKVLSFCKGNNTSDIPEMTRIYEEQANRNTDMIYQTIYFLLNQINEKGNYIPRWIKIRQEMLSNPTCSEEQRKNLSSPTKRFYIKYDRNEVFYHYTDDYDKVKDISIKPEGSIKKANEYKITENAARLTDILLIPKIKEYFIQKNYAIAFTPNEYIMHPAAFMNFYKGALGEIAGEYILKNNFPIETEALPAKYFEKFDCKIKGKPIYVDFKNWSMFTIKDEKKYIKKIFEKAKECQAKTVLILQPTATHQFKETKYLIDGIEIIAIPGFYTIKSNNDNAKKYAIRNERSFNLLNEVFANA